MSRLSVIVPVFAVEKYIEKCAISLFGQTLDDIEFIFVDDCTPDRSMEILNDVIARCQSQITEKRYLVRIEMMATNSGIAAVRRHGVELASGEYVICCDSDDWADASMYEKMYNHALVNDSDLVFCDLVISDGEKASEKIIGKNLKDLSKEALLKRLLTSYDLNSMCTAMVRRELFENILFPVGNMGEDKTIMIQLAWKAKNASYLPEPLYYYFQSGASITRNYNKAANISKIKQMRKNQGILQNFFEKEGIILSPNLHDAFIYFCNKGQLEPFLDDPECRRLWKEAFPISAWRFLFNPYAKLKSRLRFLYISCKVSMTGSRSL